MFKIKDLRDVRAFLMKGCINYFTKQVNMHGVYEVSEDQIEDLVEDLIDELLLMDELTYSEAMINKYVN